MLLSSLLLLLSSNSNSVAVVVQEQLLLLLLSLCKVTLLQHFLLFSFLDFLHTLLQYRPHPGPSFTAIFACHACAFPPPPPHSPLPSPPVRHPSLPCSNRTSLIIINPHCRRLISSIRGWVTREATLLHSSRLHCAAPDGTAGISRHFASCKNILSLCAVHFLLCGKEANLELRCLKGEKMSVRRIIRQKPIYSFL